MDHTNDYNEAWAREQDRMRAEAASEAPAWLRPYLQPEYLQPTTVLRHCANEHCCSQGGRRALISADGEHDLCTVCQKQAKCRMLIAAGKYTDWPGGNASQLNDIEMQTKRQYRGLGWDRPTLPPAA